MKEFQTDKMMKRIIIVILSIAPFISICQSQNDTIIKIDIDELGIHKETITSYVKGIKIDSVFTYFNTKWNKRCDIFISDRHSQEIIYLRNHVRNRTFFNLDGSTKVEVYSKKKSYNIEKAFYFDIDNQPVKSEFFDRNGDLITKEKKLKRLKRRIERKSLRLLRKYPLE